MNTEDFDYCNQTRETLTRVSRWLVPRLVPLYWRIYNEPCLVLYSYIGSTCVQPKLRSSLAVHVSPRVNSLQTKSGQHANWWQRITQPPSPGRGIEWGWGKWHNEWIFLIVGLFSSTNCGVRWLDRWQAKGRTGRSAFRLESASGFVSESYMVDPTLAAGNI